MGKLDDISKALDSAARQPAKTTAADTLVAAYEDGVLSDDARDAAKEALAELEAAGVTAAPTRTSVGQWVTFEWTSANGRVVYDAVPNATGGPVGRVLRVVSEATFAAQADAAAAAMAVLAALGMNK